MTSTDAVAPDTTTPEPAPADPTDQCEACGQYAGARTVSCPECNPMTTAYWIWAFRDSSRWRMFDEWGKRAVADADIKPPPEGFWIGESASSEGLPKWRQPDESVKASMMHSLEECPDDWPWLPLPEAVPSEAAQVVADAAGGMAAARSAIVRAIAEGSLALTTSDGKTVVYRSVRQMREVIALIDGKPLPPMHEWSVQDEEGSVFCFWCATERAGRNDEADCPETDRSAEKRSEIEVSLRAIAAEREESIATPGRLLSRTEKTLDCPINDRDRARISADAIEHGREVRRLEREQEIDNEAHRERAKSRKEAMAPHKLAFDEAESILETGLEPRKVIVESRELDGLVIETRTDTGEVVSRTPIAKVPLRQGDIADVTGGATVSPSQPPVNEPEPAPEAAPVTELGQKLAAAIKKDERDKDGWPRIWAGKHWTIKIDGVEQRVTERDVFEVFVFVPSEGDGLKAGAIAEAMHYRPQIVTKALGLLRDKGLARCGEGKRWVTTPPGTKPAPEPEPGRADTLPESDAGARPKLSEPATKAEALLADAAGVAAQYVAP